MTATLPLSVVVPAATAGLAYLNARYSLWYDYTILGSLISGSFRGQYRERKDRTNIFNILEGHALHRTHSQHTLIIHNGRRWTYRETYDNVLKYAAWLKNSKGVQKGDIVAINFLNSEVFIFLWLALWSLGAKPAFINYNLTGKALLHCISVSTTKLLLVDDSLEDKLTPDVVESLSSSSVEWFIVSTSTINSIQALAPHRDPDESRQGQRLQDMAILIYTSGTTGLPKPAVVSWGKCAVGGMFVKGWMPVRKNDIMYTCMPLYHSSASVLGFITTLQSGSTIALGKRFSVSSFWDEVRASEATIIQYVGETCRYLLSAPPSPQDRHHCVRAAFGNGLRPDVWQVFKDRFGIETIAEFYAATEGPSGMWNLSSNSFSRGAIGRSGSIGAALLGGSIKIFKFDFETNAPVRDAKTGFCTEADYDEPGELMYKLDEKDIGRRFQGYFGNEGATTKKILRNVLKKDDAWFSTGDVMKKNKDNLWYFCDRIGDTFRWRSENVSTQEVAAALGRCSVVEEANVYGVEVPRHDGRAGCAATVFRSAELEPSEEVLKTVADHVQAELPKYAVPLFLRVKKQLEITGTNKQQKHSLREQGVDPEKVIVSGDKLYWLQNGTYEPFGQQEFERIATGKAKL